MAVTNYLDCGIGILTKWPCTILTFGKNDIAKSMGVLKRVDPPHSEINKHVRIMTEGIEIIIVVVWKKALIAVPMFVKYM